MAKKKSNKASERVIAVNRKARHDYTLEQQMEAGLALLGWEIKSLRAGRINLKESYVILNHGQAWLIGAHLSPLPNVPEHLHPDPLRSRKLLLHRKELNKLMVAKERQGYTIVPLNLHWTRGKVKLEIAIGKGKKQHDKRQSAKQHDWEREKQRLTKH